MLETNPGKKLDGRNKLTRRYRVGLIGAGNVSAAHCRGIAERSDELTIVGITDLDLEKAQAVAKKFAIPMVYPDVDALVADEAIDVVGILVPPSAHKELTLQVLAAGKHVLCEKPMAESFQDCQQMLAAEKKSQGRLFVVQNRIHTEAMQKAREMIAGGEIGAIRLVQTAGIEGAELLDRMPSIRTDAYGALNTVGIHQTYVIPWLTGQTIISVKSTMGKDPDVNIAASDGTAVVAMEYSGGTHHAMFCTFEAGDRLDEHWLEVVGTAGRLRAYRTGTPETRREILMLLPKGRDQWETVPLDNPAVMGHEFGRMWRGVAHAIDTETEPELSAQNAARSVHIVHKIYEDARRVGTLVEHA